MGDTMRQLLEMILKQLQEMVMFITGQLEALPPEISEEDQKLIEIGREVKAAASKHILANLYASGGISFTPNDYGCMIEALAVWEDLFVGKDRDAVLSVYEVAENHDLEDSDDLYNFIEKAEPAVGLYHRINAETDMDPDLDDEIIDKLNSSVITDDVKTEIEDAVSTLREAIRNW